MGTTPGRVLFRARVPLASRGAVPRWPLLRSVGLAIVGAMVAALVTAASVAAREPRNLYVSPSGSDANPCTQTKPCATIGHAVGAAPAGSTVVVRRGTYHEAVVIPKRLRVVGHRATIDASGVLASVPGPLADQGIIGWGVLIVGPSAAGTTFQGFTVENAPAEGILAALTSNLSIVDNELRHNDVGRTSLENRPGRPARIGVTVARERNNGDDGIVIAVRDSGCGIPPDRLARIWEPYVTHKPGGTGLGLAIARQTVLAHRGQVYATSTVGEGTEIRFTLPTAGSQATEAGNARSA